MAKGRRGKRNPKMRKNRRNRKSKGSNVREYASLSVKRTITTGNGFLPNTSYNLMNVGLKDFTRAVQVAQAYQHYRIKKIALTFKPTYDTYQSGLIGASGPAQMGKPNLYFMIDKAGAIPTAITLEGLKNMGARPVQLDEKNIVKSWRPSVLESVMTQSGSSPTSLPSKYKISPWLATTADPVSPGIFVPSDVDHLGCYWYIDQLVVSASGQTAPLYTIECEVQFEFKKPLFGVSSNTPAIPAVFAELNRSPDGIVGGNDGI